MFKVINVTKLFCRNIRVVLFQLFSGWKMVVRSALSSGWKMVVRSALPSGWKMVVRSALPSGWKMVVRSALPSGWKMVVRSALPSGWKMVVWSALPSGWKTAAWSALPSFPALSRKGRTGLKLAGTGQGAPGDGTLGSPTVSTYPKDPRIVPYPLATLKGSHTLTSWTCTDFF